MNGTLFENRAFAEVIDSRYSHSGLGWPLNPMSSVLTSRGVFGHRHRHTHRGKLVMGSGGRGWNDAAIARDAKGCPQASQARKRQERFFPGTFRDNKAWLTAGFQVS